MQVREMHFFDQDYPEIRKLYRTAFPRAERFPLFLLRLTAKKKNVHALAWYDKDTLVGFSYLMVNTGTVFIAYLAMRQNLRSKGYGSRVLEAIRRRYPDKTIFLDAEAPDEKASNQKQHLKRLAFYERNGIHETSSFFNDSGVRYEILSTDPDFTAQQYEDNIVSCFALNTV